MTTRSILLDAVIDLTGHTFTDGQKTVMLLVAESNIATDVRVRRMLHTDDAFVIGDRRVAMPDGLLEVKRFRLTADRSPLDFYPENIFYDRPEYDQSGTPSLYSIEGDNFVFAPAPVDAPTALLGYLKRFDALTADDDSNWLLANHFDIYLFACLAYAFSSVQDDEQAAKYKGQYDERVAALNVSDQWSAFQGNSLKSSMVGKP